MEHSIEHLRKESPLTYEQQGVLELAELLNNPSFQERFVTVQTPSQRDQLLAIYTELDKSIE